MIHGIDTSFLVAVELVSHSRHANLLQSLHQAGDQFARAPQVLAEFVHIVTDPRRSTNPLTMNDALDRAEQLWNAAETFQVHGLKLDLGASEAEVIALSVTAAS